MGIKERKEREKDERKKQILEATIQIIKEEGLDNLSIRKIAQKIEYSPAVVYHYFKNKEDILEHTIHQQYVSLVQGMQALTEIEDPEVLIAELGRKYINWALENPELYKAIMLNSSPNVLKNSSVLFKGVARERPAIGLLVETLNKIGIYNEEKAESTAQLIWATTFGLIIRMITENTDEEHRQYLIDHHAEFTVKAVKAMTGPEDNEA